MIRLDVGRRNLFPAHALFVGSPNNFIVHIGKLFDEDEREPRRFEITPNDVKYKRDPIMSNVTIIVDGYAAHMHADRAGRQRFKTFFMATECIMNLNRHLLPTIGLSLDGQ